MKPLYKGSKEGGVEHGEGSDLVHELLVAAFEQVAQLAELLDLVREHGHLLLDTGQLLHNKTTRGHRGEWRERGMCARQHTHATGGRARGGG